MAKARQSDRSPPTCPGTSLPLWAAEQLRRGRQDLLDEADSRPRSTGMYLLLAQRLLPPCGKMPLRLDICPACGHRLNRRRPWTWVSIPSLFLRDDVHCSFECSIAPTINALENDDDAELCAFADWWLEARIAGGHSHCGGLVWLPVTRYPLPRSFIEQADELHVSWGLHRLDERLVIGETIVLVAHPDAILNRDGTISAGICCAFVPTDVVYCSSADDDAGRLARIRKRCIEIWRPDGYPEGEA